MAENYATRQGRINDLQGYVNSLKKINNTAWATEQAIEADGAYGGTIATDIDAILDGGTNLVTAMNAAASAIDWSWLNTA